MIDEYEKRGYLKDDFKVFFLTDTVPREFENHYHNFDKIVIFFKGKVNYTIEGKSYQLEPYDIVLVNRNEIHKLKVESSCSYERMIIYIAPEFLCRYQSAEFDLRLCFQKAKEEHSNVLRLTSFTKSKLYQTAMELRYSLMKEKYAGELYQKILFLEFVIHLNRAAIGRQIEYIDTNSYNHKVVDMIAYINGNLTEDLSIDRLSAIFFMSKYHMMRLFRTETGFTIGNYVSNKRLLLAKELILQGKPITQVCFDCGFNDNSTFSRAFKNLFGESPRAIWRRYNHIGEK